MGNVYTPQTIADYNLNPPSDDGSQTPANQLTWAKHKTKLADPIKTLAEAIDTQLQTAFGKVQGGITSVSDDYTVLAGDQGKLIVQTGASKTITTPAAATVGEPFVFGVLNAHASTFLTIDGNASETIDGSTTISIPPGRGILIATDGSNWFTYGQNWLEAQLTLAEGDIIYVNASGQLTVLNIGTANQELRVNSGATAPEWYTPTDSQVWTLIDETVIASVQASYDLGSLSSYRELWVEFINLLPAAANGQWLIRTDTGGADVGDSGASDYSYTNHMISPNSNDNDNDQAASGILISAARISDEPATSGIGLYGHLHFFDFNQAVEGVCKYHTSYEDESTTNGLINLTGFGARLNATARDFIQLIHSTGNIASGTIRVWGK